MSLKSKCLILAIQLPYLLVFQGIGQQLKSTTNDYGFRLTALGIPISAPDGYESAQTFELNHPLQPEMAYEIGFWIIGKQLQDRGYSYPIDFRQDVTVTGVFVRPIASEAQEQDYEIIANTASERIAERILIDSKKKYIVGQPHISIGLYDHRNIDKDVVTIYVNDKIVIENLGLKRQRYFFEVPLRPGANTITLHAENLGKVSPNTAAIIIKSDSKEYAAILGIGLGP